MTLIIWHNPRCSKSRQALQILTDSGRDFTTRLYLEDTPDAATIHETLQKIGISAGELMRTKDDLYKELNLDDPYMTDDDLIQAMADNPKLIERPVVITDDRAVIGRPPENILKLL